MVDGIDVIEGPRGREAQARLPAGERPRLPRDDRRRIPRLHRRGPRVSRRRPERPVSTAPSASPTWSPSATRRSRPSPRATSSASASPRRSCTIRRSSSSTSRPTAWTRTRRTRSASSSRTWRREGRHPLDPHPRGGRGHLQPGHHHLPGQGRRDETPASCSPASRDRPDGRDLPPEPHRLGRMKQVAVHLQARVRRLFPDAGRLRLPGRFPPHLRGARLLAVRRVLQGRGREPRHLLRVLPVALPLHRARGRHAALVRGEAVRHGRAPLHAAGDDARGRDRQVPGGMGVPHPGHRLSAFPMAITIGYLGSPDWGVVATSYLGAILMAGGFLGVCSLTSALTKNQVISFVVSLAGLRRPRLPRLQRVHGLPRGPPARSASPTPSRTSASSRTSTPWSRASWTPKDVVFFLSLMGFTLFLNVVALER
jgi:hypothetical protein